MERWVAIILGLLVIVIGFVVVAEIMDVQNQIPEQGASFECLVNGGTCQESCTGSQTQSEHNCGSGVCCVSS